MTTRGKAAFSLIALRSNRLLQVGCCAEQAKGEWFDPRKKRAIERSHRSPATEIMSLT